MLRGTRIIEGKEADFFVDTIGVLEVIFGDENKFERIIVPSIWEEETFSGKVGPENTNMMWKFKDKGDRNVCLIPEVTGIFQEIWRNDWSKKMSKRDIFYVQRCYRYERPQEGRYREFTQFGIEMLRNNVSNEDVEKAKDLLKYCLNEFEIDYVFTDNAKRGLSYYTEDGFEAKVEKLGAQKQIAGGGKYAEGVGWAIGIERLVMSRMFKDKL